MKYFFSYVAIYFCFLGFSVIFPKLNFVQVSTAVEYCVPPNYYTGPFTGITNFNIGKFKVVSGSTDGYMDFTTSEPAIDLIIGSKDSVSINLYYDPSMLMYFAGNVNIRIWVDWNGDFDFDDEGEEVIADQINCSSSSEENPIINYFGEISVPSYAKTGTTRLRVYEDMAEEDGHDTPIPCGYLNSDNVLGQHGECEDYSVNVINPTSIDDYSWNYDLDYYPNPTLDWLFLDFKNEVSEAKIIIYDILGKQVFLNNYKTIKNLELDLREFETGFYIMNIKSAEISRFLKISKE